MLVLLAFAVFRYKKLIKFISHQQEVDKMYLYNKDPYETKYQFLI